MVQSASKTVLHEKQLLLKKQLQIYLFDWWFSVLVVEILFKSSTKHSLRKINKYEISH
jgi:hypothetical protein